MDRQFSNDKFRLVQEHERLMDKPFKTKQLTYFQDAMTRFGKNKYNIVAFFILLTLILLSIFVPVFTPERLYNRVNSSLAVLPPRIPGFEKLGVFDGMIDYKNIPVDASTIDPLTDIGLPKDQAPYLHRFIDRESVENYLIYGSDRDPLYVGGTNQLFVAANKIAYSVSSPLQAVSSDMSLEFNILNIVGGGSLKVYIGTTATGSAYGGSWDNANLVYVGEVTSTGITSLPLTGLVTGVVQRHIILKYELPEISEVNSNYIELDYVKLLENDTVIVNFTGHPLSAFTLIVVQSGIENGSYNRKDAAIRMASFRYDIYSALFSDKQQSIGEDDYLAILAANPGMEASIEYDPQKLNAWSFGEGYPIIKVDGFSDQYIQGIGIVRTYNVMMNGKYLLGFDEVPYFYFGTDVGGRDLFSLIFLGLRTSLLLGFIVTAVNVMVGVIWGSISAYYGGKVDILMERFVDIWSSFPAITMIVIITAFIPPGFWALFIFLVYDGWVGAASITRSQFYRYKGREYVLAARTLGASDLRIIFKHILPNAIGTIVTRLILAIPGIIFVETNLSFLGFGIGNGQKFMIGPFELTGTSVGVILADGQSQIYVGNLWMIVAPTLIVSILMITFNMFGNALRDALNPQLRGN